MFKKLSVASALALLASVPAMAQSITISAAPSASSLVTSLETAYGLAVGLGMTVLGIGLVVMLIRRGVKTR